MPKPDTTSMQEQIEEAELIVETLYQMRSKDDWEKVEWLVKRLNTIASKSAEETLNKITEIDYSIPQTTYKSVFEKQAFTKGYMSAIKIIQSLALSPKQHTTQGGKS